VVAAVGVQIDADHHHPYLIDATARIELIPESSVFCGSNYMNL
jgi:hypothetical protein